MRGGVKAITVRQLAAAADVDVDEALIALWEAGIDDVSAPADLVPRRRVREARSALGIGAVSPRTIHQAAELLDFSDAEVRQRLEAVGYRLPPTARSLPSGAWARLSRGLTASEVTDGPPVTRLALPSFEWKLVGKERHVDCLTAEEVNEIHWRLVDQFEGTEDPISPPGIRDEALFHAAVGRPQTSLGEQLKYASPEMAAAALLHSLTLNHAFHNGNKRTALVAALVMLDANGLGCTASEREALKLVLRVAKHSLVDPRLPSSSRADAEVASIAEWVVANTRPTSKGEKTIQFRTLRQILGRHGCELSFPKGTGNRINIERTVESSSFFGMTTSRRLRTQVGYRNEGSDVKTATISKIREDLQLDDVHGCDSSAFYSSKVDVLDEVIARYQATLKGLARL